MRFFWPLLGTCANFAFPFISHLRKESIHFDDESRRISNILAGIATSAVVLFLYVERHRLHVDLASLPRWHWLILAGIGMIAFHSALVSIGRHSTGLFLGAIRGLGLCVYVLAFGSLALGFNWPFAERIVYVPVEGRVECRGVTEAILVQESNMLARSPLDRSRHYRFLLRPGEIKKGLAVRVHEEEVIVSATQPSLPQLGLDIACNSTNGSNTTH